ncbi:MAG TPA: hypothetical protein VNE39_24030 [Planctomycetota bacterium]|nr:hypothetical protein [Planctomycetota bacterium]
MARVQTRSNIYTLLPILATLIMAGGITFTWLRINEYKKPPKPTILPPAKGRQNPDIEPPKAEQPPEGIEEGIPDKAKDEGEVAPKAPDEEPGEAAPEKAPEAAPEKAPEAAPEKAPEAAPEKAPEAPEPPQKKAEEEEK